MLWITLLLSVLRKRLSSIDSILHITCVLNQQGKQFELISHRFSPGHHGSTFSHSSPEMTTLEASNANGKEWIPKVFQERWGDPNFLKSFKHSGLEENCWSGKSFCDLKGKEVSWSWSDGQEAMMTHYARTQAQHTPFVWTGLSNSVSRKKEMISNIMSPMMPMETPRHSLSSCFCPHSVCFVSLMYLLHPQSISLLAIA